MHFIVFDAMVMQCPRDERNYKGLEKITRGFPVFLFFIKYY